MKIYFPPEVGIILIPNISIQCLISIYQPGQPNNASSELGSADCQGYKNGTGTFINYINPFYNDVYVNASITIQIL
jgi:hypothetical protein